MEPTSQDIAAVANALGEAPAPTPAPAPTQNQPSQQPEPTQQPQQAPEQDPAPTPNTEPAVEGDPFASIFTQQPTEPNPQQPITPAEPQPTQSQPPQQSPEPQSDDVMTVEQYMDSITSGVSEAPEAPDLSKIDPNDEGAIKGFFDDLMNTAVARAKQEITRENAVQTAERKLWDEAFEEYGSLKTNKKLRDMVHAIRMSEFQKGRAITPKRAADQLLSALKSQYKQGIADNQVQTKIEEVQPTGGGGQTIQTTADMQNVYQQVQTGGEVALAQYLDSQVKAGNL